MLASYGLSRTLTPITIGLLLKGEHHGEPDDGNAARGSAAFNAAFERGFERMRTAYVGAAPPSCSTARSSCRSSPLLVLGARRRDVLTLVGRDFFPLIDGGQIQLHVRAPAGTRIETTEAIFQAVEDKIREVIPENDRELHRRQYRLAGARLQSRLHRRHRPSAPMTG